ncbi:MAG: hypothetical protein ACJ749_17605 [Flavisolibacter sp.]|jgi:hypothetical protein
MNWTLALLQAIIIAGISAIISYRISTRQKQLDFSYDYRKYILEKRKKAYDELEPFIIQLRHAVPLSHFHPLAFGFDTILESYNCFKKQNAFWVSREMDELLMAIVSWMDEFKRDIEKNPDPPKAYIRAKWVPSVYKLNEIESQFFIDIMQLDNITAFKDAMSEKYKFWVNRSQHEEYRSHQ